MRRALAERWTRPRDLARAAGWIVALREPPDLRDLLLRDVLALAPLSHAGLERALVAARRGLLDAALAGGGLDAAALEDACALARQGFLNEYVWECSAAELAATDALAGLLAAQLARNEVPAAGLLMALAMYRPLGLLPGAALVAADVPAVASVLAQQITEPAEEARLRAALPRATAIDGAVSAAVREQYEANPYPRWGVLPGEMRRVRLADWLGGQFPGVAMPALPDAPEVLVAGCGTGQHPIELARRFADLRLTAMDLSAASLGYAARMAAQAGVAIEFLQGDLLRVHELGRQFDVIEASGVLHHLADPWAGWRALLGVLRPGGVMNVSLYTQRGRADVRRARARIGELGLAPTLDGIRACRRDLAALDEDWARRLALSPDFAAASGCRDLLFHVQEQALGLPEIAAFLDEAGLVLLGVDAALPTRLAFQAWCGAAAGAARGLARWDAFEAEHPGCFAGMVHLWVAKPAV